MARIRNHVSSKARPLVAFGLVIALITGVIGVAAVTASSVSAHTPDLSGVAVCIPANPPATQQQINWSLGNDDSGNDTYMQVISASLNHGTLNHVPAPGINSGDVIVKGSAHELDSSTYAGSDHAAVTFAVVVEFFNTISDTPEQQTKSVAVSLGVDCGSTTTTAPATTTSTEGSTTTTAGETTTTVAVTTTTVDDTTTTVGDTTTTQIVTTTTVGDTTTSQLVTTTTTQPTGTTVTTTGTSSTLGSTTTTTSYAVLIPPVSVVAPPAEAAQSVEATPVLTG